MGVRGKVRLAPGLRLSDCTFLSLEEAREPTGIGPYYCYMNRWWAHLPGKGLIFYRKSPQCNSSQSISKHVARMYPDAEVIFVERAYILHDCRDYA